MIDLDKPRYFNALAELVGGSENLTGGSSDGPMSKIGFIDGISKPTESAVQTKLAELIVEWTANEYARNRAAEYPSQGDQNDMMYKDTKNSTTTHADAVEAVKTKWPKDNSGPVE